MMANPGGSYPGILGEFQFSVLNRCDNKMNTTRQVIFVKPLLKPITKEDVFEGVG